MRPRFILLALLMAAVLWPLPGQAAPAAADPLLFVSFVRIDSPAPIIYPPQQLTLAVQVATDSVERVPVAAFLNTTAQLRREEGHYSPWMSLCDEDTTQELVCFFWVSATKPITFSLDLHVRSWVEPGVITPTLRTWPMSVGLSAMITETVPLTVIAPQRVYLPRVAR
jgi:hypothetical protein